VPKNPHGLSPLRIADKSPICTSQNSITIADKSDDYSSVDNNLLVLPSCGRVGLNATLDSYGDDKCYLPFNLVVPP
jgi:hypothetical protein